MITDFNSIIITSNGSHTIEGFPSAEASELIIDTSGATAGSITLYRIAHGVATKLTALPDGAGGTTASITIANNPNPAVPVGLAADSFRLDVSGLAGTLAVHLRGYFYGR